jgi:hypothetical protein
LFLTFHIITFSDGRWGNPFVRGTWQWCGGLWDSHAQ